MGRSYIVRMLQVAVILGASARVSLVNRPEDVRADCVICATAASCMSVSYNAPRSCAPLTANAQFQTVRHAHDYVSWCPIFQAEIRALKAASERATRRPDQLVRASFHRRKH